MSARYVPVLPRERILDDLAYNSVLTYNGFGEALTVTDPLGNVTTNQYDANGNLLSVTSPAPGTPSGTSASVTQFAYNALGELVQITDPLGHVSQLTYTPAGLIATITDAQQNVTSYQYDAAGRRTAVVDALHQQTSFAYDAMGRLTGITYPDSTTAGFAYDSRGRRTSATDPNQVVTRYVYDDADRLLSVTTGASQTQYAYDTESNLLSVTDAAQHVTSFSYDGFGRVVQMVFPSTLAETYGYDAVGNLTSKIDRKGQTIQYVYDALNRLTHKGYPDSTGVDYVYDLVGKVQQVTDPTGSYGFAYDNLGRLLGTTTQYAFLPGTTFSNAYTYDAGSNRTGFTAPDGSANTYQYDTLNRLANLTSSASGAFTFGYDAASRRTGLNRPNGVSSAYSYDSKSNLLSVLHQAAGATLDGASYAYDPAGNRTAKTNRLNNITEQYAYDPLYELTQVTQGAAVSESYTYDAVGNRLSSLGTPAYNYNSSNELTAAMENTYSYDNNGNLLAKANASGTTQYRWDFENRLNTVVLAGTGGTVSFQYDPFGRRIQKKAAMGGVTTTTNYVYDGANVIAEADQNGNVVARYTQGVGIDEPLAEVRGGGTAFYQQDGLGSVTSLSGATGTLSNSYTYDTFGNLTAATGTIANPFQYTARDYDSETGLRYYRARYYDPALGRFISEDPIGFAGSGPNFYAYVFNNPINLIDPFGLAPGDWWDPRSYDFSHYDPWDTVQDVGNAAEAFTDALTFGSASRLNDALGSGQYVNRCGIGHTLGTASGITAGIAMIPNISSWVKNPLLYEVGSTTVPSAVYEGMQGLNAIEKGSYLLSNYGWMGTLKVAGQAAISGEYAATIGTGLTPGGWLAVIGASQATSSLTKPKCGCK